MMKNYDLRNLPPFKLCQNGWLNHEIRIELSKYTFNTLLKFEELYPCKSIVFDILEVILPDINVFYLSIDDYDKFWFNWNQFKKLKLFI